ncbi:hypothetical protein KIPB_012686, partial [Kipferlia bialata]|eukprot:g12686.t1
MSKGKRSGGRRKGGSKRHSLLKREAKRGDAEVTQLNPEIRHDMRDVPSVDCWHMDGMISTDPDQRVKMGMKGKNTRLEQAVIDTAVQARYDQTLRQNPRQDAPVASEAKQEQFSKGIGEGQHAGVAPISMKPYRMWLDDQ